MNLAVSDGERSRAFYERALGSIGIVLCVAVPAEHSGSRGAMFGFGYEHKPHFWIVGRGRVGENTHIAFTVESRDAVHTFYRAALEAGGEDNGPPGLRTMYHPTNRCLRPRSGGINVEAVCHEPG